MIVLPPVPCLLSPPVLAELQQADLITSEECEELTDICDVVEAQWDKPPEVNVKSADVLRRHGFWEKSRLLQGRQSVQTLTHLPVLCGQSQARNVYHDTYSTHLGILIFFTCCNLVKYYLVNATQRKHMLASWWCCHYVYQQSSSHRVQYTYITRSHQFVNW